MSNCQQNTFPQIRKRDGRLVPFDQDSITRAICHAMEASQEGNLRKDPQRISAAVVAELNRRYPPTHIPQVEEIQDIVEETLILTEFAKTAKAYILYRHHRAHIRAQSKIIPEKIKQLTATSKPFFPNSLAEFIYYRTYSRWLEEENRRETWIETIARYMSFMREKLGDCLSTQEYEDIQQAILQQQVMPSMRLLWSAGKAARENNITAYNCAFIAPTRLEDLAEILYLLMAGVGVGFSVESQAIQQLSIIQRQTGERLLSHRIGDSKEGWGKALKAGLRAWYGGKEIDFDYSQIRPAGSRLRTMGGRSSGPAPLRDLLAFARAKILGAQGRRLRNIDIHDLICKIGEIVAMGGVRRAALISLSDLEDEEMRQAKSGHFYINYPYRAVANNSAVYETKPTATDFLKEWLALAQGGTGERGLFNRGGLPQQLPPRRWPGFEPYWSTSGTNPCGEIILRNKQFCNLSEVVARPEDTEATLLDKIRIAAILGTYQSTLTHFPYLSPAWKRNCEEERLLGVSITGQWDALAVRYPSTLNKLRDYAIKINRIYAQRLGINASAAATCVKPSGTVSQLVDAASGMHPRHAPYYVRRVRISAQDPLFAMLKAQKFPYYPEVGQDETTASTFVLEFPVRTPAGSITRDALSALDQLEYWKLVKENYTEHNPSVTITVAEEEWIAAANWLYNHWDILGGLSFLPQTKTVYQLAPFEEISAEEYQQRIAALPKLDFSRLVLYEKEDTTLGAKEPACVGGNCELDPEEGFFTGNHPNLYL
jgi:ribonucleoside-triphosphate reductase (thioredoxin)